MKIIDKKFGGYKIKTYICNVIIKQKIIWDTQQLNIT